MVLVLFFFFFTLCTYTIPTSIVLKINSILQKINRTLQVSLYMETYRLYIFLKSEILLLDIACVTDPKRIDLLTFHPPV